MTPRILAGLVVALSVPLGTAWALTPPQPIRPESRVWVTGASNIRRFTCNARELSGALDLHGRATRGEVLVGDNFDVALDQNSDGVNPITCRLLERINTQEGIHVSHS